MGKVNIGLRGWRFEEEDVFTEDGRVRPLDNMPAETRARIARLAERLQDPCDACWLLHGPEEADACNAGAAIYGEPMGEVVLCPEHERDFVYWYQEAGGSAYRGEAEMADRFHEWFLEGNRAPEWFEGIEHVDEDPDAVPEAPDPHEELPGIEEELAAYPDEELEALDVDLDDLDV
ncbi:MAG: hypothetical protein ABEJ89_03265 [Haloarculaceae archaeon]